MKRLGELERAVMDVLWESAEPLTVRQVGARLTDRDLAHTTVMTVLDRLAKKGLVERLPDPTDRRGVLVRLTVEGQDRADQALAGPLSGAQVHLRNVAAELAERGARSSIRR